ncbi:MAG: hypothetical protein ACK5N0_04515 [Synechococcaceae cyanobacterium]
MIDFKAIPQANKTDGNQDRFELFARDFVKALGYEVEEQPGRGQDGGKDLLIRESLTGILQTIPRRWLLSAKHFAHSGKAVGTKDEINIRDRVDTFDADGFLGFYSTLPSSGLINAFKGLKKHIQVDHFDSARIGQYLLTDRRLDSVFKYYFPESYSQFLKMGGYQAATTDDQERDDQFVQSTRTTARTGYPGSNCSRLLVHVLQADRQERLFAYASLVMTNGSLASVSQEGNHNAFSYAELAKKIVEWFQDSQDIKEDRSPIIVLLSLPAELICGRGAYNLLLQVSEQLSKRMDPLPLILNCSTRHKNPKFKQPQEWRQAGHKSRELSISIVERCIEKSKPLGTLEWLWVKDKDTLMPSPSFVHVTTNSAEASRRICSADRLTPADAKGSQSRREVHALQGSEALLISWKLELGKPRALDKFRRRMEEVLYEGIPFFLIDSPVLACNGQSAFKSKAMPEDHPHPIDFVMTWSGDEFIANYATYHQPLPLHSDQSEGRLRDYLRHSILFWDDHRFPTPLQPLQGISPPSDEAIDPLQLSSNGVFIPPS